VTPSLSEDQRLGLAVAAALAEDEARRSRRPAVSGGNHGSHAWSQRARLEGLRLEGPG
jgi:hypothetical protein